MARYIDADKLIEFITKGLNNPDKTKAFGYDAIEILTEIEYAPAADVVPKSEVERLTIDMNAARLGMIAEHERLKTARADVAREILEDISTYCTGEDSTNVDFAIGYLSAMNKVLRGLAEIKQKYTEEKDE